jgi:hypothetical protein
MWRRNASHTGAFRFVRSAGKARPQSVEKGRPQNAGSEMYPFSNWARLLFEYAFALYREFFVEHRRYFCYYRSA